MRPMKTIIAIFFLLLLLTSSSYAQNLNWAKNIGAGPYNRQLAKSIAIDHLGNSFIVGYFMDSCSFDIGSNSQYFHSAGQYDIFIQKRSPLGDLIWVKHISSIQNDEANSVAIDKYGNVYITGFFMHTTDFDPGVGVYNLTSNNNTSDCFILKLNPNGEFIWAKRIGGNSSDKGSVIRIDSLDNLYITGSFNHSVDFDPSNNNTHYATASIYSVFLLKLDLDANFIWVKTIDGTGLSSPETMTLDTFGNFFIAGIFRETVDFDPGPGIYNLTATSTQQNLFVQKLDTAGNFVWAQIIRGHNVRGLITDNSGDVYCTGTFQSSIYLNFVYYQAKGAFDIFTLKLDSLGHPVWGFTMGDINYDLGRSLDIDSEGNLYAVGTFSGTIDIDPSPDTFNISRNNGSYIQKISPSGNLIWAISFDNIGSSKIKLDDRNNIYILGDFTGTPDFDPHPSTFSITSTGFDDIYLQMLDSSQTVNTHLIQKLNVKIYPNPVSESIHVNLSSAPNSTVEIININGQTLYHKENIHTTFLQIKTHFPSGIYFLVIKTRNQKIVHKFIKN